MTDKIREINDWSCNDFKNLSSERIKELAQGTAYPRSHSVANAIKQALNEQYHLNKHLRDTRTRGVVDVESLVSFYCEEFTTKSIEQDIVQNIVDHLHQRGMLRDWVKPINGLKDAFPEGHPPECICEDCMNVRYHRNNGENQ